MVGLIEQSKWSNLKFFVGFRCVSFEQADFGFCVAFSSKATELNFQKRASVSNSDGDADVRVWDCHTILSASHFFILSMVTTRQRQYNKPAATLPSTPNRPVKVSDDSTPGESSESRTSRLHVWPVLLEDIEANGGIKLFLGKNKTRKLDKLLAKLIEEDQTGNKAELYSLSQKLQPVIRGTVRRKVNRWKILFKEGEYESLLKDHGITPFDLRPKNKQVHFSPSDDFDSTIASIESEEEDDSLDSLESSRPPSVIVDPRKQAKKEQKKQRRQLLKVRSLPAPATPTPTKKPSSSTNPSLPSEITVNVNRIRQLDSPASNTIDSAPPAPTPTTMSLRGLTLEDPIRYDPTNKDPLQAWPLYVMKIIDIPGVGEHSGKDFSGFMVKARIDPNFTSDQNNRMNLMVGNPVSEFFRCRMVVRKNILKVEIPCQDYLLMKKPELFNIANPPQKKENVMRAMYTANREYQESVEKNNGRDLVLPIFLQFPDSTLISAKHVNDQRPEDVDENFETVVGTFDFGTQENAAPNIGPFFRNTNYYAMYFVADLKMDTSNMQKAVITRNPPSVSDVATALAVLEVESDDDVMSTSASEQSPQVPVVKKPDDECEGAGSRKKPPPILPSTVEQSTPTLPSTLEQSTQGVPPPTPPSTAVEQATQGVPPPTLPSTVEQATQGVPPPTLPSTVEQATQGVPPPTLPSTVEQATQGVASKPQYEKDRKAMFKSHLGKQMARSILDSAIASAKTKRNELVAKKRGLSKSKPNAKKAPSEPIKKRPSFEERRKDEFNKKGKKEKENLGDRATLKNQAQRDLRANVRRGLPTTPAPTPAANPVIPGSHAVNIPPETNPFLNVAGIETELVARMESNHESFDSREHTAEDDENKKPRAKNNKKK